MSHFFRGGLFAGVVLVALGFSGLYAYQGILTSQKNSEALATNSELGPLRETPAIAITQNKNDYAFKNKKLYFTTNQGSNWLEVPATMAEFFGGEYETATSNQLLADSYLITPEKSGLLIVKKDTLAWMETFDGGKNWQTYTIFENFSAVRYRKIQFFDNFATVIVSGGRVMNQESLAIATSSDGGHSWQSLPTLGLEAGSLISAGAFVDEGHVFISRKNQLLVSQYGGNSFQPATINQPEKYQKIFVLPEMPRKKGNTFSLLVNQGDSGDYQGGKTKGLFQSLDNGLTFDFVKEVNEQEVEN